MVDMTLNNLKIIVPRASSISEWESWASAQGLHNHENTSFSVFFRCSGQFLGMIPSHPGKNDPYTYAVS